MIPIWTSSATGMERNGSVASVQVLAVEPDRPDPLDLLAIPEVRVLPDLLDLLDLLVLPDPLVLPDR